MLSDAPGEEPVLLARSESSRERSLLSSEQGRSKASNLLRRSVSIGRGAALSEGFDVATSEGQALGTFIRSRSMSMRR